LVNIETKKRVFDVKFANKGIELKIDDDLLNSLNSGHLEQQIRDMKDFLLSFPETEIWIVTNSRDPVSLYRLNTLCQNYGIWWAGCSKHTIADKIFEIIRDEKKNRDSRLSVRQGHHNQNLEESLAHLCAGFSVEFAHYILEQIAFTDKLDIQKLTPAYLCKHLDENEIRVLANQFYGRNMDVLSTKIAMKLGV